MHPFTQQVRTAAADLSAKLPFIPDTMVVLGSGLNELELPNFQQATTLEYAQVDGLQATHIPSHAGEFRFVRNDYHKLVLCAGRHHLYEGFSAQDVCLSIYAMASLGVKKLVITNAAGGLNPAYQAGDVMIINDHINVTGHNPVRGQDSTFGVPFPDMSQAYNKSFIARAQQAALVAQVEAHQGIYIGVLGPSLETSAERRMLRGFGADVVGMSTVCEVIAANHCGMQVLGISAITNKAVGDAQQQVDTLEEVLANAKIAGDKIAKLLAAYFTS